MAVRMVHQRLAPPRQRTANRRQPGHGQRAGLADTLTVRPRSKFAAVISATAGLIAKIYV